MKNVREMDSLAIWDYWVCGKEFCEIACYNGGKGEFYGGK